MNRGIKAKTPMKNIFSFCIYKKTSYKIVSMFDFTEQPTATASHKLLSFTTASKASPGTLSSLNFDCLKDKPRLSMKVDTGMSFLSAGSQYLVHFPMDRFIYGGYGSLSVLNVNGQEQFHVKYDSQLLDISWSSSTNQFLLGLSNNILYSLDISTRELKVAKQILRHLVSCTCYEDTLLITSGGTGCVGTGSVIEVYDMKDNFRLVKSFQPPESCKQHLCITKVRLNFSGLRLHVTLYDPKTKDHFFELRDPTNMHVLAKIDLPETGYYSYFVLSLPTDDFLYNEHFGKELFLIDSNGKLQQKIQTQVPEKILTLAFIADSRCLVILTGPNPFHLHFFDL
jgi:hypothetical protein